MDHWSERAAKGIGVFAGMVAAVATGIFMNLLEVPTASVAELPDDPAQAELPPSSDDDFELTEPELPEPELPEPPIEDPPLPPASFARSERRSETRLVSRASSAAVPRPARRAPPPPVTPAITPPAPAAPPPEPAAKRRARALVGGLDDGRQPVDMARLAEAVRAVEAAATELQRSDAKLCAQQALLSLDVDSLPSVRQCWQMLEQPAP